MRVPKRAGEAVGASLPTVTVRCGPEAPAPAPALTLSGAPNATRASTPAAMRAATRSVRTAPVGVPT